MEKKIVIIIGGGIAGLTAAIHLSKTDHQVVLVEKHSFPRHKVCGEYISNEVLPYLKWLDADPLVLHPTKITKTILSTSSGELIEAVLPLGGFGISRYVFDNFLRDKAEANGASIIHASATSVAFENNKFTVNLSNDTALTSDIVLGAFGKRSNIDQQMRRFFTKQQSRWLAVKAHYSGEYPEDTVGLYNFKGGYCGISKVENGLINICYLADYKSFKQFKNIDDYNENVVYGNPHLKQIIGSSKPVFEKPLTISQISFASKKAVEDHILMIGDTAGLINPLCGNGMAMAIHSAKIVSELIGQYSDGKINTRDQLEKMYESEWRKFFKPRFITGRMLANAMQSDKAASFLMGCLTSFPFLLPKIIRKTHGELLNVPL
ncbi:MAG TPA: NAD(P)/FAD-dependent oxidoreductase [Flavobacterium sp.]|jgi:hypothetical protein